MGTAHAQEQDDRTDAPRVFLDCSARCDDDFLRSQITLVDYVRDRRDADVHVILTSQPTGGGVEYTLQFIGAGRFPGMDQTLRIAASETSTADERRSALAEVLKRGLVRYLAETPLADRIVISFTPERAEGAQIDGARDPWNLWVLRTTVTGTFSGESLNSGRSIRLGASASRTSEAWRLSVSSTANYRDDRFDLGEHQPFRSISKSIALNTLAVKSLNARWSAGLVAAAASSTFLNYDLRLRAAPGIEYNVFPYTESTRRMLTVQYTIGLNSFDYREETIFGRLSERLVDHRIGMLLTMVRPWGSAGTEATFLQFLGKPDKYNLSAVAQANVRIAKGLSLNALITVSRTNDQLYLPREGATLEEILVRQQQLATSYRYSTAFGVTYTFGSIFNNVVNPRFGRGGDDFEDF